MTQHTQTLQSSKSGQEVAKNQPQMRLSKTHRDFWQTRVFKPTYKYGGKSVEVRDWAVRLRVQGRRELFNLKSNNRAVAAATAREIYIHLVANGWESTLHKFKPEHERSPKISCPTVGDLIEEVRAKSGIRIETVENYARKFRSLVAAVANIPSTRKKHDYYNGGHRTWQDAIHAIKLSRLTPANIQAWKIRYIQEHGINPLAEKQAKNSVNTILRNSKALFSRKALRFANLEIPEPHPFTGVDFEKPGKCRYRSEIHPELLLTAAYNELALHKPEAFKILLLGLGAGLRRDEIDTLTWEQLDFERGLIRVETNVYTAAKSSESEAAVDVDPTLMEALQAFKNTSGTRFVVNSNVEPRRTVTYHHYRCYRHFRELTGWLRGKGITATNPIHALRKEFGSLVCQQYGLYAASMQLRHADIRITREHYLDKKQRFTVKISPILNQPSLQAV